MTTAKERPILFKGEMIRAILNGSKTQTRRIVKLPSLQPWQSGSKGWEFIECNHSLEDCNNFIAGFSDGLGTIINVKCLYGTPADPIFGRPSDRLWVREAWAVQHEYDAAAPSEIGVSARWHYAATEDLGGLRKRPSIFLPRRGSRILLEITAVRVERLNAISEADARAEGIADGGCLNCGESEPCGCADPQPDARGGFAWLWQSINGSGSWHANPWVWVVEFRKVQP